MQLTTRGRVVVGFVLGAALGVGVAVSRPVDAQGAPGAKFLGADAAAIIAWFEGFWGATMQLFLNNIIVDQLMGTGNTAIVEQVAANTAGTIQALQQTAGVVVGAITEQQVAAERAIYERTFGTLTTMSVDGRQVTVGSVAPSACRRVSDARRLESAAETRRAVEEMAEGQRERFSSGQGSYTATVTEMYATVEEEGPDALDLGYLQKPSLTDDEARRASKAAMYALNPEPLPQAPQGRSGSAVGKEYELRRQQFAELSQIPAAVQQRQIALRTRPSPETASYLETVQKWAADGIENSANPIDMQGVTEAGVQREMTMALSALLWVETERMQSDHERNQLLSILAARELQSQGAALREQHARMLTRD